jgi:UDP-N-acetylglucosamine 3-dehydrogenase
VHRYAPRSHGSARCAQATDRPARIEGARMSLHGAVIGLGQIGHHHARLLQASDRVAFAGAVDTGGDRYGTVHDSGLIYDSIAGLLATGPLDFAIVALPTAEHRAAALELAAAGVHVLVEKPVSDSVAEAQEIIAGCERAGVKAAAGHVERYNPALRELRRRMGEGQLGEAFLIATERVGPFPDRVLDVGVVMDLATHDLDLVRWLAGPIESLAAQTSQRMGRPHEDLVSITGRVVGGTVFTSVVDRVTPTKVRRTRVVGEHGMLLADTLSADLTFFENAHVVSDWERAQDLRGVAEGDTIRYALAKREPLLAELEAFLDWIESDDGDGVVTLAEGVEAVRCAEAALESARTGETVHLGS